MLGFDKAISSGSWTHFYSLNHFNRFTSYSFLATFSSFISFPYSSAPLPAVWRPDVPASPSEVAQFQTDCLQIILVLSETQVFTGPSFEGHTAPHSLAASTGFFWCWFWRCKVWVLFMWQADLSKSYILGLQMIQNVNFYPEGKNTVQKIIPFP